MTSQRHCTGRRPAVAQAPGGIAAKAERRRSVSGMADLETTHEESTVRKDTNESPTSERDTEVKQTESVESSSAVDGDVDESDVSVLPGTGGPDDVGDVDVDPDELNL